MIAAVHRRDTLLADRRRLTAEIDARIAEVEAEIRSLLSGADPVAGRLDGGRGKGHQFRILVALKEKPGRPYDELTQLIYGDDYSENRSKLRALIYNLKKKGLIEEMEEGGYRVVE